MRPRASCCTGEQRTCFRGKHYVLALHDLRDAERLNLCGRAKAQLPKSGQELVTQAHSRKLRVLACISAGNARQKIFIARLQRSRGGLLRRRWRWHPLDSRRHPWSPLATFCIAALRDRGPAGCDMPASWQMQNSRAGEYRA